MKRDLREERTLRGILGKYLEILKRNLKFFVPGIILVALLIVGTLIYLHFEEKRTEDLNYLLSEGIKIFREGLRKGDKAALSKSEEIFERVAREKRDGISDISLIYIARIKQLKGEEKEAREILEDLREKSESEIIKIMVSSILGEQN